MLIDNSEMGAERAHQGKTAPKEDRNHLSSDKFLSLRGLTTGAELFNLEFLFSSLTYIETSQHTRSYLRYGQYQQQQRPAASTSSSYRKAPC